MQLSDVYSDDWGPGEIRKPLLWLDGRIECFDVIKTTSNTPHKFGGRSIRMFHPPSSIGWQRLIYGRSGLALSTESSFSFRSVMMAGRLLIEWRDRMSRSSNLIPRLHPRTGRPPDTPPRFPNFRLSTLAGSTSNWRHSANFSHRASSPSLTTKT